MIEICTFTNNVSMHDDYILVVCISAFVHLVVLFLNLNQLKYHTNF